MCVCGGYSFKLTVPFLGYHLIALAQIGIEWNSNPTILMVLKIAILSEIPAKTMVHWGAWLQSTDIRPQKVSNSEFGHEMVYKMTRTY